MIIADWIMPDLDGLALCRNIRSSSKAGYAYFILLTAKNRKEDIINGLEAGADDYVTKPLYNEEIRVRIRAAERIQDFQRELTEKNTELLKLNTKLQEMACIDVLTGIGNRRSFYAAIEKMHHRACRYGQPSNESGLPRKKMNDSQQSNRSIEVFHDLLNGSRFPWVWSACAIGKHQDRTLAF